MKVETIAGALSGVISCSPSYPSGTPARPGFPVLPGVAFVSRRKSLCSMAVAALIATLGCCAANGADSSSKETIVLGQSLPLSGTYHAIGYRIREASRAYVESINAKGGLNGKQIELVTLDDIHDPQRYLVNMRSLISEKNAVAILNCYGDSNCAVAAAEANKSKVPLIGPISGARALRGAQNHYVFSVRADYAVETQALATLLHTIGVAKVAILTDKSPESEATITLRDEVVKLGIQQNTIHISDGSATSLAQFIKEVQGQNYQALLLDIGLDTVTAFGQLEPGQRQVLPPFIAVLSSINVTQFAREFRGKSIGFTSVVPNPELVTIPLVSELQKSSEKYSSGDAVAFDGLEAFISTKIAIEGLRQAGPKATPEKLTLALEGLSSYDLGGFFVSFNRDHTSASKWVDTGVSSKTGLLLR